MIIADNHADIPVAVWVSVAVFERHNISFVPGAYDIRGHPIPGLPNTGLVSIYSSCAEFDNEEWVYDPTGILSNDDFCNPVSIRAEYSDKNREDWDKKPIPGRSTVIGTNDLATDATTIRSRKKCRHGYQALRIHWFPV
jgi:hypothetical protein